jgi:hypothetical protein
VKKLNGVQLFHVSTLWRSSGRVDRMVAVRWW